MVSDYNSNRISLFNFIYLVDGGGVACVVTGDLICLVLVKLCPGWKCLAVHVSLSSHLCGHPAVRQPAAQAELYLELRLKVFSTECGAAGGRGAGDGAGSSVVIFSSWDLHFPPRMCSSETSMIENEGGRSY